MTADLYEQARALDDALLAASANDPDNEVLRDAWYDMSVVLSTLRKRNAAREREDVQATSGTAS